MKKWQVACGMWQVASGMWQVASPHVGETGTDPGYLPYGMWGRLFVGMVVGDVKVGMYIHIYIE